MTSFEMGRQAENVAAAYMERQGCTVVDRNWRTRWCEIDIVACRHGTIYFCEVKYRSQSYQGYGLEYITPRKLRQMRFAAALWIADHSDGAHYELCAIEVSGRRFQITAVARNL